MAAIKYIKESLRLKEQNPKLILAVPVLARETYEKLKSEVDRLVALEIPEFFSAVGQFYREFEQLKDEEVAKYLK